MFNHFLLLSVAKFPYRLRQITYRILLIVLIPLLTQCQATFNAQQINDADQTTIRHSAKNVFKNSFQKDELHLNQVQFLGSHNSYKRTIDPELLQVISQTSEELALSLDYAHLPLEGQLDLGIRKLELDVFYDPSGDLYQTPLGLKLTAEPSEFDRDQVMATKGFKVFHIQDIDFRSHCLLFADCLNNIRVWSEKHPAHFPIIILINAKDSPIQQLTQPLKFDEKAWADLDAEIRLSLKDRLLSPDDIRGNHDTLRQAILAGWPKIKEIRGKIMFVLDDSREKKQSYVLGHSSLRGRSMFIDAEEPQPEAAFRIVNDPIQNFDYIQALVKQGFIVRTRADADTIEARTGDTRRLVRALESGAQIISTDYYLDDKRFPQNFVVKLPNGQVARCNPRLIERACDINQ